MTNQTMKNSAGVSHKPVTIADVARQVGVTKMTVSNVLNGRPNASPSTREAVLRAVEEMGFQPNLNAQRLSSGRDRSTIGLFVIDLGAGVGLEKIRRIQAQLTRAGYDVPIYSAGSIDLGSSQSHAKLMSTLRRQKPAAIVCVGMVEPDVKQELLLFQEEGGHLICVDMEGELPCDQVYYDKAHNTYLAARHLMELGHREVGLYIDGRGVVKDSPRYQGFARALQEFGGATSDEWLLNSGGNFENGALHEKGGLVLAEQFLSWEKKPSAMCVVNDASAVAFIAAIGRAGFSVPATLSVVGHDDLPIAAVFTTPVTTVSQPIDAIASGVSDMLLSRLRGEYDGPSRTLRAQGELIVRDTTAPLP